MAPRNSRVGDEAAGAGHVLATDAVVVDTDSIGVGASNGLSAAAPKP